MIRIRAIGAAVAVALVALLAGATPAAALQTITETATETSSATETASETSSATSTADPGDGKVCDALTVEGIDLLRSSAAVRGLFVNLPGGKDTKITSEQIASVRGKLGCGPAPKEKVHANVCAALHGPALLKLLVALGGGRQTEALTAALGHTSIPAATRAARHDLGCTGKDTSTVTKTKVKDGKDGKDGDDGKDGKDGKDGDDGKDGKDGSDGTVRARTVGSDTVDPSVIAPSGAPETGGA